ncbi:TetR/AcrR family transcriptional regulator [Roseateles microcysteis]|uniref:TetR/AcrR family transcriptional regulator n=1 Tax=Roseateles microcysteis TaxID=3119057 RepID=UPI002FE608F0
MSKPEPSRQATQAPRDAYHHGALREALIAAAETVLAERGLEGFSLREVARRSGVSPAAPAHHFGDAQGLLVAVATLAFDGLSAALKAGDQRGGPDPVAQLREQGLGYVDFALQHPGRFGLMFRCEGYKDEALERSGRAAFGVLEDGMRRLYGLPAGANLSPQQFQALLMVWSVVHGFAHLALAGQFDDLLPASERAASLRATLAGMLELQLQALRPAPRRKPSPAK